MKRKPTPPTPTNACAVCGMPVAEQEAIELPPAEFVFGGGEAEQQQYSLRKRFGTRHASCGPGIAYSVGRVLGVTLTEVAAGTIAHNARMTPTAIATGRRAERSPFDFLRDDELMVLRHALETWNLRRTPHLSTQGACGMCGISHSLKWWESVLRWSDNTAAPMCADCHDIWQKRGRPRDVQRVREIAREALTGVSELGMSGMGMRTYSEVSGDDHGGHPRPWSYSPAALGAVREAVFVGWPELIKDPVLCSIWTRVRDERIARLNRDAQEQRRAAEPAW